MKKIYFKFNWMSFLFLAPVGGLWFLFFISQKTTVYPLNNPIPIPINFAITYSMPFLLGIVLASLKIKGLYWWEWVEIILILLKFEYKKNHK